jgi:glutaconate CoA-transferase subunit A
VALIHVPAIDQDGNAHCAGELAADQLLARAARRVVVTYERRIEADPALCALSRLWIDDAIEAAGGAAPTACDPDYGIDKEGIKAL